jgi:hypothetical protein
MSRRTKKTPDPGPARPTITVCRGCCCDTAAKVPRLDHEAQLADLRTTLAGWRQRGGPTVRTRASAPTSSSPPPKAARPAGGPSVNNSGAVTDITAWVKADGPGLAEAHGILDLYTCYPSRRVGHELEG